MYTDRQTDSECYKTAKWNVVSKITSDLEEFIIEAKVRNGL